MSIEIQIINKASPQAACLGKVTFLSSTKIFTTNDELALLRLCAESIKDKPQRSLLIIAKGCKRKIAFINTTLMHLGVSCGQIATRMQ